MKKEAIGLVKLGCLTRETHYPVLTLGAGNTADLILVKVDNSTN